MPETTSGIRMTPASRAGRVRKIIGVTLMVIGLAFNLAQQAWSLVKYRGLHTPLTPEATLFILSALLIIPGGAYLFWRGRSDAAKADAGRILTDSKADVLYLRAFRTDQSIVGYLLLSLGTMFTEEEELADVLRPFGDLVTIGQPGERLPKPGAARIYASEEEWKEVVKRRMRAARLVIIRAGGGEHLLWELKQAVETLDPEKVLILVHTIKSKDYESFRAKVNPVLGMSLPELAKRFRRGGFIAFTRDWKPSFLPLRAPYFRRGAFSGPNRAFFKFALRPVFERFGLEWQPPPVRVEEVAIVTIVALIAVLNFIIPTLKLVLEIMNRFVFTSITDKL
jgi:hypothetical protein